MPVDPQLAEMVSYLKNLNYRCSERLKPEEIRSMYNIIFGTHQERIKRLPETNKGKDCFGDYAEELKKSCYFSDGICCAMFGPCKIVTEIQKRVDKLDSKEEK